MEASYTNPRFNDKLFKLMPGKEMRILDLGCSGGGFVLSCIDSGHIAVGLEGSDYSLKRKRAAWRLLPDNLFTCDITKPFKLLEDGQPMKFDCITAWEVLEHIPQPGLPELILNIRNHLAEFGIFIASIADYDDWFQGVNLHQTVHNRSWWIELFGAFGLEESRRHLKYFNGQFVRGKQNTAGSFHIVFIKTKANIVLPKEAFIRRLHDHWIGCKLQRILAGIY